MSKQSNDSDKQKDQHRRSVETLGLSGRGDTAILPEIYQFCIDNDLVLTKELALAFQDEILKARINELSNVQLEYGRYIGQTFINGQAMTIEERLADLQSQLTKSSEGESNDN